MINWIYDFHKHVKENPKNHCKAIKAQVAFIDKLLKSKKVEFKPAQLKSFEGFSKQFKHIMGECAGYDFVLGLEQKWMIACVLSIKEFSKERNKWVRFFKESILYVSRKNGKTFLAAVLLTYLFFFDDDKNSRIYNFAENTLQAQLLFEPIVELINQVPQLKNMCKVKKSGKDGKIINLLNGNELSYGSGRKKGKDGTSPSIVVFDESHEIASTEVYEAIITGQKARAQPLVIEISTAGVLPETQHRLHYAKSKILLNDYKKWVAIHNFIAIFELDEEDDYTNSECWIKANPRLMDGGILLSDLKREFLSASLATGSGIEAFRTKTLNQICDASSNYFFTKDMVGGAITVLPKMYNKHYAYVGVDLAERHDLCNVTILIPYQDSKNESDFHFLILQKYFYPQMKIDKMGVADRRLWNTWRNTSAKDEECVELLYTTEKLNVDFNDVADWVVQMSNKYDFVIRKVGYDLANSAQFVHIMESKGFSVEQREYGTSNRDGGQLTQIRQGRKLSPIIKQTRALFENNRIRYDKSNTLLLWCFSNCKILSGNNDNEIAVDKKAQNKKIDGAIGVFNAMMAFECDKIKLIEEELPFMSTNKIGNLLDYSSAC